MVNIPPRTMVMTGGWFMMLFYPHEKKQEWISRNESLDGNILGKYGNRPLYMKVFKAKYLEHMGENRESHWHGTGKLQKNTLHIEIYNWENQVRSGDFPASHVWFTHGIDDLWMFIMFIPQNPWKINERYRFWSIPKILWRFMTYDSIKRKEPSKTDDSSLEAKVHGCVQSSCWHTRQHRLNLSENNVRNSGWRREYTVPGTWLVVWLPFFIFPLILGISHHPNWRTHIFQRGGPTTNQVLIAFCSAIQLEFVTMIHVPSRQAVQEAFSNIKRAGRNDQELGTWCLAPFKKI